MMMEDTDNLEKIANENLILAENEKKLLEDSKNFAQKEIKKAKARENLVKNELELAEIRENYAQKSKNFLVEKEKLKSLLNLSEDNLKYEENQAIYNKKVSLAQKKIAEVHKKISSIEMAIAGERLGIYRIRLNKVKARTELSKFQHKYVKLVNNDAPEIKCSRVKNEYEDRQAKIKQLDEELHKKYAEITTLQNKLADFKKELAIAITEREKIRSPLY
ncbi:MAG: hypothetical protein JW891_13795 [Candidatus Lokiarchaeota archaeon]|nr:hypothetical protein [Candidatus Lokiarchaeota archaeon]